MFLCKTSKKISSKSPLLRPQSWRRKALKKKEEVEWLTSQHFGHMI